MGIIGLILLAFAGGAMAFPVIEETVPTIFRKFFRKQYDYR